MAELEDRFEIFSGEFGREPIWMSTVTGLATAERRMRDFATCSPGAYFVYSVLLNSVVASLKIGSTSKVKVTRSEYPCDDVNPTPIE